MEKVLSDTAMNIFLTWSKVVLDHQVSKSLKYIYVVFFLFFFLKQSLGQAQWLMPVIPALCEAEVGGSQGPEMKALLANVVNPHLY